MPVFHHTRPLPSHRTVRMRSRRRPAALPWWWWAAVATPLALALVWATGWLV